MKKTLMIAVLAAFAAVSAHASDCESKASTSNHCPSPRRRQHNPAVTRTSVAPITTAVYSR